MLPPSKIIPFPLAERPQGEKAAAAFNGFPRFADAYASHIAPPALILVSVRTSKGKADDLPND